MSFDLKRSLHNNIIFSTMSTYYVHLLLNIMQYTTSLLFKLTSYIQLTSRRPIIRELILRCIILINSAERICRNMVCVKSTEIQSEKVSHCRVKHVVGTNPAVVPAARYSY